MTELDKARQKYSENLRNYYAFKDQYEEHYMGTIQLKPKDIQYVEMRMGQHNDVCETLVYIFGEKVR